jgi:hypothetical protein
MEPAGDRRDDLKLPVIWIGPDPCHNAVLFGTPVPLSQVPQVASVVASACFNASVSGPAARDLVIPFNIVSTLNSSVPVQVPLGMIVGDFRDSSANDSGIANNGVVVIGNFSDGLDCDGDKYGPSGGGTVTLSREGVPVTFQGWLVFQDAITPHYPNGNIRALGQTYAQLDMIQGTGLTINNVRVTGPGVCVGHYTAGYNIASPPFLHIGGPQFGWEQCTGHFVGSPN